MGNAIGRGLAQVLNVIPVAEQAADNRGTLYATIDNVWKPKTGFAEEGFEGSWAKASTLRNRNKPDAYRAILNKVSLGEGIETLPVIMGETDVVKLEETSHSTQRRDQRDMRGVEPLSKDEKEADGHIRSFLGTNVRSRAHLVPKDIECYQFWGMVAELITGFQQADLAAGSRVYDKPPRDMVLEYLFRLRINRFIFPNEHNVIFDTLSKGSVVPIPLMTVEEMANWEYKKGYKVMVICSGPETYEHLGPAFEQIRPHINPASEKEIKKATAALEDNVKILADSLVSHWDNYFSKFPNGDKRKEMLKALKAELEKKGVRVPQYLGESVDVGCGGIGSWLPKLYTIDLATLYTGDYAHYIPDPWLLALKAAINWSGHCYKDCKLFDSLVWKLLPACSDDDDLEEVHVDGLMFTLAELKGFKKKKEEDIDADLRGREICFIPNDEDEKEDEEEDDVISMNLPVVSDDEST